MSFISPYCDIVVGVVIEKGRKR